MFHVEHLGHSVVRELSRVLPQAGFSISDEQRNQLAAFADELLLWNERTNLTTITDPKEIAIKHFLDSFYGLNALISWSEPIRLADIGAGAGFPGIPLKIMRQDMDVYLIEKNAKKCAFISNIIGKLKLLGVKVCNGSFERLATDPLYRGTFSHVVVRAMDIHGQANSVRDLLKNGGLLLAYATPGSPKLSRESSFSWLQDISYELPCGMGSRSIAVYQAG